MLNHNTETVPRLYRHVRPGARFARSLELLRRSKEAGLLTKSGIMVGLGEEWDEVLETIRAIRDAGTDVLTVGQYLRPSPSHLPIVRYWTPEEFARLRELALGLGYAHVESGPLVRSSYHAEEHVAVGYARLRAAACRCRSRQAATDRAPRGRRPRPSWPVRGRTAARPARARAGRPIAASTCEGWVAAGGAGGARGDCDPLEVQGHQQALGRSTLEREVRRVGHAGAVPVPLCPRDLEEARSPGDPEAP